MLIIYLFNLCVSVRARVCARTSVGTQVHVAVKEHAVGVVSPSTMWAADWPQVIRLGDLYPQSPLPAIFFKS